MTPEQMRLARTYGPAAILFVVFFMIGYAVTSSNLLWGLVLAFIAFAAAPRVLTFVAKQASTSPALKNAVAQASARAAAAKADTLAPAASGQTMAAETTQASETTEHAGGA